uniref:Uncharacterized protein n=1 Tax=uncultured marine virus TaxID=186617 RepID=A0A0F7L2G1_9VIRU|nr:hypothetical protein CKL_2106 [uncultured marine virus]
MEHLEPIQKSITTLMQYNKERVKVSCPVCCDFEWEYLDQYLPSIVDSKPCICKTCGFITYNPQLKNIMQWYVGEKRPQSVGFLQTKANKIEKHKLLIGKFLKDNGVDMDISSVLDYGCSDGYLLEYLRDDLLFVEECNDQVFVKGIEINAGHANWAKYIKGLDVTTNPDLEAIDGKFDLVCLYHVLEHVQQPGKFLDELSKKIVDGGYLYLALPTLNRLDYPNIESVFKDEHINYFTDEMLEAFLWMHGFKKVFFDNVQYGTCMVLQKKHNPKIESPNFYSSNLDLIKRISHAYKCKLAMEDSERSGDRMKAVNYGVEGLKAFQEFPELITKIAAWKDDNDTIDYYEDAIDKMPHLKEIQASFALHYYKMGEFEKAKEMLLKLCDEYGRYTHIIAHLAYIEYQDGNLLKAVEYCQETVDKTPFDQGNFSQLASIVMAM